VATLRNGDVASGLARASDGRMQRPRMRQAQNTTISAVGVWQNFIAEYQLSDANWEGDVLRFETLPNWVNDLHKMEWNADDHSRLTRSRGDNLVVSMQLLQIVRNPDARIPWPDDLKSPYDSVYDISMNRMRVVRSYNGPSDMGIPKVNVYQDFEPDEW
jgi:hypothetical protein